MRYVAPITPLLALLMGLCFTISVQAGAVYVARIDGTIGPATSSFVSRAISEAQAGQAETLIIELDTPGGMLDPTKQIVQAILASPVPVIVYVSPRGATAASAGCFIVLAADVAAMAPATTIGAAHPVTIGQGEMDDATRQKLENYAASYIEAIAARRNRNTEWARSAVLKSALLTADAAREQKVIEVIAEDRSDLLRQLDGRSINGHTLHTGTASIATVEPSLREQFFQMVSHPEFLVLLMLVAMYGIIGELSNPGAVFPGVIGAIALILGLYMSSILPINLAGVALILLAICLFVTDVFAPTHGVLTVGGAIAFFLGVMMMFDRAEPMLRLSMAVVPPATVVTVAFFAFVVGAGLRAQWRPHKAGSEALIGQVGRAVTAIGPARGKLLIEGEYWTAVSNDSISPDAYVEVVSREGLTLHVKPAAHAAGG